MITCAEKFVIRQRNEAEGRMAGWKEDGRMGLAGTEMIQQKRMRGDAEMREDQERRGEISRGVAGLNQECEATSDGRTHDLFGTSARLVRVPKYTRLPLEGRCEENTRK